MLSPTAEEFSIEIIEKQDEDKQSREQSVKFETQQHLENNQKSEYLTDQNCPISVIADFLTRKILFMNDYNQNQAHLRD